jgi:hypothetical protein
MVSDMLTVLCEVLSRRDGTDARKGDGHEGRGIESRKKGRNNASTLKVRLYGEDAKPSVIGGLGLNEGAQEAKSEAGRENEHDSTEQREFVVNAKPLLTSRYLSSFVQRKI